MPSITAARRTKAVLFDVDYTLIYPGPTFQGEGYQAFCARHGIAVDPLRFDDAVRRAVPILDAADAVYHEDIFVSYTRQIIEGMGGTGTELDGCAREIYAEWAACHHFELYEDVPGALQALSNAGIRVGLVSNSHRCLSSFQTHFALHGLIAATVSSSEHGWMKPHPSIFAAALELVGAAPDEAIMIGDSIRHDVEGACAIGMRAALIHRGEHPHPREHELANLGVRTIRSLNEVPALLQRDGIVTGCE
jgi:putative hydrolase of the HAD superfamily